MPRWPLFLLSLLSFLPCACWGLAASSSPTRDSLAICQDLRLDVPLLQHKVASGHVYQQRNFLDERHVQLLLEEIRQLEQDGAFQPSGLSNTVKGKQQNFGQNDRSTCVVPWWKPDDELTTTTTTNSNSHPVSIQLRQLQLALSQILNRPTLMQTDGLAHECYYSQSRVGSSLPRHMDERHEELKGPKGWLLPSRRSISWLIYLSDDGWDLDTNGGALTYFPQHDIMTMDTKLSSSTHNGNLQVGWLLSNEKEKQQGGPSQPVYLNSWLPLLSNPSGLLESHCVLYVVQEEDGGGIQHITRPWLTDTLQGMSVAEFLKQFQSELFVNESFAQRFALLEDRAKWDQGDIPQGSHPMNIVPERGSLVLFDSVLVPHQVELITKGTRRALAGWFHEETQPFPEFVFAT